jgi:hypothetical protein
MLQIVYSTVFRVKQSHGKNIDAAEDLKAHLETLEMFSHDVLELKQRTISEIENYPHPPKEVHNTMQAMFLLLGECPKYLRVCKINYDFVVLFF